MSLPQVVSEDVNEVTTTLIAQYESAARKRLYPAQIERLLIDLIAYCYLLLLAAINDTARQGLVDFAREPMLSYHGAKVNTYRLPAKPAKTTLRFSVAAPVTSAFAIPGLPRIAAPNGALFVPVTEPVIQPGSTFVEVTALAIEVGAAQNGHFPDTITEAFDPLPDGVAVTNVTTSSGGHEQEDIERFRERIKLAQSRPGAGSPKQYRYLAMSADVSVIDVSVSIIAPGHVRIALLLPLGADPTETVATVWQVVHRDDTRPTTDHVDVVAAEVVNVPLSVVVTPRLKSVVSAVQASTQSALAGYSRTLARTLGYDVVRSEVESRIQGQIGIKRVVVDGADIEILPTQYAVVTWSTTITEAESD